MARSAKNKTKAWRKSGMGRHASRVMQAMMQTYNKRGETPFLSAFLSRNNEVAVLRMAKKIAAQTVAQVEDQIQEIKNEQQ